jgi:predicted DCC family thiol-disulfide oxidoreductase YuxK
VFDWVDITDDASGLVQRGISYDDGLRRLHAEDGDRSLHVGVDAFLLIWRHLPRWRLLALVVGVPGIQGLASLAYRVFADWRFKRLGYASCAVPVK